MLKTKALACILGIAMASAIYTNGVHASDDYYNPGGGSTEDYTDVDEIVNGKEEETNNPDINADNGNYLNGKDFFTLNKYHTMFKANDHFILGTNTPIYKKDYTAYREKIKKLVGFKTDKNGKTVPVYDEYTRNGDVYAISSTTKLSRGTAFRLVAERDFYIGMNVAKTTFWEIEHIISKQKYYVPKVGTMVSNVSKKEAEKAGYRLHFTFYGGNVYATDSTVGYKSAILSSGGSELIFNEKNKVDVNKYTKFKYLGLYDFNSEYYVYMQKLSDGSVIYVNAKSLKGGVAPYPEEKPTVPTTPTPEPPTTDKPDNGNNIPKPPKPDNGGNDSSGSKIVKPLIYGKFIIPNDSFGTVYTRVGRGTLVMPTKLYPNKLYKYVSKQKLGNREYYIIEEYQNTPNRYFVYVDEVYEGTHTDVLSGEEYEHLRLNFMGETTTRKSKSYFYTKLGSNGRFNPMDKYYVPDGRSFTGKRIEEVRGIYYIVGDLQASSKTYYDVYMKANYLNNSPYRIVYDENIRIQSNKVIIPTTKTAYQNVKSAGGKVVKSGNTLTTNRNQYYTIVSSKTVAGTVFAKIKEYGGTSEYFVELNDTQIEFH